MRDIYLYEDCPILINKLGIKNQQQLDDAEADYVSFRLRDLLMHPLKGDYGYRHLLEMHFFIFQDLYDWAGTQRKVNIYKEEPVLGGLSVEYSDVMDIAKDASAILTEMNSQDWEQMSTARQALQFTDYMAKLWKVHCFREGNTRTVITFCCQYADKKIQHINRELFEKNSQYVRTALVAYNAIFSDLGDLSKKEYLQRIVTDAFENSK